MSLNTITMEIKDHKFIYTIEIDQGIWQHTDGPKMVLDFVIKKKARDFNKTKDKFEETKAWLMAPRFVNGFYIDKLSSLREAFSKSVMIIDNEFPDTLSNFYVTYMGQKALHEKESYV